MSNDLNQCQFIGRLGKDCDSRYTATGEAVTSFSIAVGSQWKDKAGEKHESTEWVSVTAFGKLGEICGEYLKKGSQIFLSGRMKTDKYQAKDGTDRYSTKIIADHMQMLGGKPESQSEYEDRTGTVHPSVSERAKVAKDSAAMRQEVSFEDDIPF